MEDVLFDAILPGHLKTCDCAEAEALARADFAAEPTANGEATHLHAHTIHETGNVKLSVSEGARVDAQRAQPVLDAAVECAAVLSAEALEQARAPWSAV